MIIYSVLPSLLPLAIIGKLVWKRDTSSMLSWIFLSLIMIICEGILKNTIKQARPNGTCDCSYGMPSSHSATSYGFLVWIYLEIGFPLSGLDIIPGARGWSNPQYRRMAYIASATIIFVPVPFSRVYFGYHSVAQVLVGILVGTILALGWFGFLRGLIVPKAWLDKLVLLRPFRAIRAINDYRPRTNHFRNHSMSQIEQDNASEMGWNTRTMEV